LAWGDSGLIPNSTEGGVQGSLLMYST